MPRMRNRRIILPGEAGKESDNKKGNAAVTGEKSYFQSADGCARAIRRIRREKDLASSTDDDASQPASQASNVL